MFSQISAYRIRKEYVRLRNEIWDRKSWVKGMLTKVVRFLRS